MTDHASFRPIAVLPFLSYKSPLSRLRRMFAPNSPRFRCAKFVGPLYNKESRRLDFFAKAPEAFSVEVKS